MTLSDDELTKRINWLKAIDVPLLNLTFDNALELTGLLQTIQANKDIVNKDLVDAIDHRSSIQMLTDQKKSEYDATLASLLSTDSTVQSQKTESLRLATAHTLMPKLMLEIAAIHLDLTRADLYLKVAQNMYHNLSSINENAVRQLAVLELLSHREQKATV
jgi:hypothetical protein